jgi:hypothetical protein
MNIDDVEVVGGALVLATDADVDGLESRLWITFPEGYREYITRLGEGVLGGSMVRVYPPWRIERELEGWRARIKKYWFWDEGKDLLPRERAPECIIVGDTLNGDELVFHPSRRDRLFVLPRDSESVFDAGADVLSAVDWICSSGELVEPFDERRFEPFDSRTLTQEEAEGSSRVEDPEGESLDEIIEVGRRWAERHSARRSSLEFFEKAAGKGKTAKFLFEAIALELEGGFPYERGYLAVYSAVDSLTGKEVGVYRFRDTGDSTGGSYEPRR